MASSQLKAKRVVRGDQGFRNEPAAGRRYKPVRPLTQFHFNAPANPAAERRRAIGVLGVAAIAAIGAFAAFTYFAGLIAAAIVAAAVAGLVGFGNWVLNHTADLW